LSEKRFALIIANDKYDDESLSELQAPRLDANALANVLGDPESGNFLVQILVNKQSHRVDQAIETFFSDRGRDDLLLLYFSGHGVKDEDGKLYFATPDTKRDRLMSTAVSASFVNDLMRRTRARTQVLLLDCCYSGAFAKGMIAKSGAVGTSIRTNDYFQGRGRVVLTASDAMQYAFEEGELVEEGAVNSIFTSAIVDGIKTWKADRDNDDRISITELHDYVDSYVHERTPHQRPSMWSFETQGEIIIAEREYIPEVEEEIPGKVPEEAPEEIAEEVPEEIKTSVDLEPPVRPVRAFPFAQSIALLIFIGGIIGIAYWQGIIPFSPEAEVEVPEVPLITHFTTDGSTLSWNVLGATTVGIDNGIGNVALSGTTSVSPDETTTYTLTASNGYVSRYATVQVAVEAMVVPVIDYFEAEGSTLSWSVSGATSVRIDNGIGNVALSGTTSVSPDETTTYTLTATNGDQSTNATVQVAVEAMVVPVIDYFEAEGSTLSWNVLGATTVRIDNGIGNVALSGTTSVSPDETTTYTLTATYGDQSTNASVQVVVEEIDVSVIYYFSADSRVYTFTFYHLSDTTTPTYYQLELWTEIRNASVPIDYVKVIFPEYINGKSEQQLLLDDSSADLLTYFHQLNMPSPVTGEFIFEVGASGETHRETVYLSADSYCQATVNISSPMEGQHFASSGDLVFDWTTDQSIISCFKVCLFQGVDHIFVYDYHTEEVPLYYNGPKLDPDYYNLHIHLHTPTDFQGEIQVDGKIYIDN